MTETLRFYTETKLGPVQSLTPDGFLLCENVPLARVGTQFYAEGEIPVQAGPDKIIRVLRDPDEVFAEDTIASFSGKPVTNDHPFEMVGPVNWRTYAVGVVLHPRRGDGYRFDSNFLYADLLIQDADAITDVRAGKREVSAGYDCEYEQISPGEGRQHRIVGNHVALVEKGRCGPRCAIGDSAMPTRPTKFSVADVVSRIMKAHYTGDDSALVSELAAVTEMIGKNPHEENIPDAPVPAAPSGSGGTTDEKEDKEDDKDKEDKKESKDTKSTKDDEGATLEERVDALERALSILLMTSDEAPSAPAKDAKSKDEKEDEDEDDDEKKKKKDDDDKDTKDAKPATKDKKLTGDSAGMVHTWQELMSRAELLAPGIRMPTFDAKAPAQATMDAMCKFRRKALNAALQEDDSRDVAERVFGGTVDVAGMTCDAVSILFNGASEMMRKVAPKPATGFTGSGFGADDSSDVVRRMNERNRKHFNVTA